jgi:hypothetical protein
MISTRRQPAKALLATKWVHPTIATALEEPCVLFTMIVRNQSGIVQRFGCWHVAKCIEACKALPNTMWHVFQGR